MKQLQELVDIYIKPASLPSAKDAVVPAQERKIVFGGLEALFYFHKESLLPALEEVATPLLAPSADQIAAADEDGSLSSVVAMAVGRTFRQQAAFMKMYSTYIK